MKKVFLYFFAVLLFATVLSSCLGDTESFYERQRVFAVVSEIDGAKVAKFAINGGGYAASSANLSGFSTGDIIFMSCKIDPNKMNSSGVIPAEYLTVSDEDVYRASQQVQIERSSVPESIGQFKFKTLSMPPYYSPNDYFLNRWLFTYSFAKEKNQEMSLRFFYDENNQEDVGEQEDTYIIDVRLDITGMTAGTETTTSEGGIGVNFNSFKSYLRPKVIIDGDYAIVNLWFRYYREGATDGNYTLYKGTALRFDKES